MTTQIIESGGLRCPCCRNEATEKIAYILYPMAITQEWLERAADRYGASLAVVNGMDWDNDLTPWKAPGVPAGSPDFEGRAAEFLDRLTTGLIPDIERRLGFLHAPERTLTGVSLSGLFTMWQWAECDFFHNIATLSGSFWYSGFAQWLCSRSFAGKTGKCFMLLGDAEPRSGNPVFATVGACTDKIAGYLHGQGVDVTYDIVRGNHYQYPAERLDMAMSAIF